MHRVFRSVVGVVTLMIAPFLGSRTEAQALGEIAFPTSGAAAAQPDFVRGVLLMHSFEYEEAASAFQQAQKHDPTFAMAYWGEALTHTHQVWNQQDLAAARAALARLAPTKAARAALAPTARERAYLSAVETLYGDGSKAARDTLYANAMLQVMQTWPEDDEAKILYATALFGLTQGVRDVPTYMRAGAIAQDVFTRNRKHPGAAHMIIHAFDDPVHAPLGLTAAREYSVIAPGAAHAQHMTTHIFLALGLWKDVVAQNIVAAGSDSSRWQAGHYPHWLLYGYLQQGRYETARQLLASLTAHGANRANVQGALANFRARYVIETARWDSPEALALASTPAAAAAGEDGYVYGIFAAGYAAAKRGDRPTANAMLTRLATANAAIAGAAKPGANGTVVVPVIMELTLRAALAAQDGQRDNAIRMLTQATALEDAMPAEFGPPAVVLPTHEPLGALLLAAGRPDEAAAQYATGLSLQPGRSAALLGLARAESARNRPDAAMRAYAQLADNWRDADSGVAGLAEARRASAKHE